MLAQRMPRNLGALLSLVLAASISHAQQPSGTPAAFTFTQPDLDLLEQSNQLDEQFQEKGLVFNDRDTTRYISSVGQKVLPAGPPIQNVQWHFFVLREPTPNAFALPNGSIYVHTGLLAILDNEAQLAGVLAHEETHVLDRHGYIENRSDRKKSEAAIIALGAANASGFAVGPTIGTALFVGKWVIPAALLSTITGYNRQLEEQADLRAVRAVAEAGYSADEMEKLFDALEKEHDVNLSPKTSYQDHPKLEDRKAYVSKSLASLPVHSAPTEIGTDRYLIETESAIRQDAELAIAAGQTRTAVWIMERIVKRDDKLADNFNMLGEAYRGLGARTPEPTPEELTPKGKERARKMLSKMTPEEYEEALAKGSGGQQALASNEQQAEKNYLRAIQMSPELPGPYRGLGFLYEEEHKPGQSAKEFRKYLELAPSAVDAPQITKRLDRMEKAAVNSRQTSTGKSDRNAQ